MGPAQAGEEATIGETKNRAGDAPRDEAPVVRKGRNQRAARGRLRIPAAALDSPPSAPLEPFESRSLGKKEYERELRRLKSNS